MTLEQCCNVYLAMMREEEPNADPERVAAWCFYVACGLLRTAIQHKVPTHEQTMASASILLGHMKITISPAGWEEFKRRCPNMLALDIPDQFVNDWLDAEG